MVIILKNTEVYCIVLDDTEQIATRTLAFTRYKRNHDLMNEVFRQAAYGKFAIMIPISVTTSI
jgi:hypothetical protein